MVAQIDEHEAAVVADAMAPAGEPDRGAVLREAKRAAGMGAITMHDGLVFAASSGVSRRAITEKAPGGKREVRIGGPWSGPSSAAR